MLLGKINSYCSLPRQYDHSASLSLWVEWFQNPQPESFCIFAQILLLLIKLTEKYTFDYNEIHRQVNQEKQLQHSYLIGQMDT